jgi:homoserine dehydrogenase
MTQTLGIGLVGAGTVGGGVLQILRQKAELLQRRSGVRLELRRAADLDRQRLLEAGVAEEMITTDYRELLGDPAVDVVVELVGGTGAAYEIVESALAADKAVVTANKALLAERGAPLFRLAGEKGVPLLFEAAVCGAIPIISAIRDGLVANEIAGLLGIVNGTCNYVLTQMLEADRSYAEALAEAQSLGYAEADPTFDVEGMDSAHKLALLAALGFETVPEYPSIPVEGVSGLQLEDVRIAAEMGYVVKLLAVARPREDALFLSVHPALLPGSHPLASVSGSMNGVSLVSDAAEESMLYGRGAGALPTASAVVSDLVALARTRACGGRATAWYPPAENALRLASFDDYRCRYFLRFDVDDRFGVLGRIATILGEEEVSIATVVQKGEETPPGEPVPVVILTHTAREGCLRRAVERIEALDVVRAPAGVLRVEE